MAYLTQKNQNGALSEWIGGTFGRITQAWVEHRLYRRTYTELSNLSSRELDDLGISRSMISRIAAESAKRN